MKGLMMGEQLLTQMGPVSIPMIRGLHVLVTEFSMAATAH